MYAMYQITFWRLVYGNQLQKYVSNISKENITGEKSINKKKLAQIRTKHFAERTKSLFRLLNSYERTIEILPFQNFLRWPENDLTLRAHLKSFAYVSKLITTTTQILSQLTFSCSKSAIETSEKGVIYVQS